MITIFRKEMKKWHSVLWVVFASMAISGVSLVFWRSQGEDAAVAQVNGKDITAKDYKKAVLQLQRQFSMISAMYGIPFDVLIKTFMGGQDLQSLALDNAIKATITERVEKELGVMVSHEFFKEELVKSLPQGIADAQGRLNREMYENYLQRLSMTPSEFEQTREEEFKRDAVDYIIGAAAYSPKFVENFQAAQDQATKSFTIVKFDQADFKGSSADVNKEEVKRFYEEHKERYRLAEKKQVRFAVLSPKEYKDSLTIDEQSIQSFYEKNKANRYRIPPKISVRHIFLTGHSAEVKAKAENLLAQIKKDPASFASVAKAHSQDKETASKGGLTEHFNRGAFDTEFEKEAFKLMKKGDLAPVVRTTKGYEIIMLEDRINAAEKPLREVKEEIVATLRERKALNQLKGDLEAVMHNVKSNGKAFDEFVTQRGLKVSTSDVLSSQDGQEDGFEGKLVERLFGKSSTKGVGYFSHRDEYVIYQVIATEKSTIPSFSTNEKKVTEDFLAQAAADQLKHFVKSAKGSVLEGKRELDSYKAEGFNVVETGMLKKGESLDSFKEVPGLADKAFLLDDKGQVLEFRSKGDTYLIQLVNIDTSKDSKIARAAKAQRSNEGRALVHGFIASLQRNAKITVNETLMNAYKSV